MGARYEDAGLEEFCREVDRSRGRLGGRCCCALATYRVSGQFLGQHPLTCISRSNDEPWAFADEDLAAWEKLISYTLAKALDNGVEPQSVLEQLAGQISEHHTPTWSCATRIVDVMVSNLDIANSKDVPLEVMDLVNLTMVSSYPPAPRNKIFSRWLIRAVAKVLDECPLNLVTQLLQKIQEGLSMWISDEYKVFTSDEYNYDVSFSSDFLGPIRC
jgi:hypothetical protein